MNGEEVKENGIKNADDKVVEKAVEIKKQLTDEFTKEEIKKIARILSILVSR